MTENGFQPTGSKFFAAGVEYKMEYIPSEHFHSVLSDLLILGVRFGSEGDMDIKINDEGIKANCNDEFFKAAQEACERVLKDRIYDLMADIIKYQNDNMSISAGYLRKHVRLKEMASFIAMIANDDEIIEAVEVFIEGAGKFLLALPHRVEAMKKTIEKVSEMQKSLHFSQSDSGLTENTSTNDYQSE